MMNLSQLVGRTQKLLSDNSPLILTTLGVVGTGATAYYTAKATFHAAEIIQREESSVITPGPAMTPREKAELVWKLYIPAVGVAVLTSTCIVFANRISTKRTVAMAAAYTISERAYSEYKEKVIDQIGKNKEQKLRDELAEERVNRQKPPAGFFTASDDGSVWCHDAMSNQFFRSDMESLRSAVNSTNELALQQDHATITDFYEFIGSPDLETTAMSSDFGWTSDKLLVVDYSTVMYKDKYPAISMNFTTVPIRDPWRFR